MTFLNPAINFVRQHGPMSDIQDVYKYTEYLLSESGIDVSSPPIDLEKIRKRFGFPPPIRVSVNVRGGVWDSLSGIIFLNETDGRKRSRFTFAHELMELAFIESKKISEGKRFGAYSEERKELVCERGAAALLMPSGIFSDYLNQKGVSLASASDLAQDFDTSFLATVINMVTMGSGHHGFAVSQNALKPTQIDQRIPRGQVKMFESLGSFDPRETLRIRWSVSNHRHQHLPRDKSFPKDSAPFETWNTGRSLVRQEFLDLGGVTGKMVTENKVVRVNDQKLLYTLFHLPGDHCF